MDTSVEQEIVRGSEAVAAKIEESEASARHWIEAVGPWLQTRWQDIVDRAIAAHPEIVTRLATTGELGNLKASLTALEERAAEVAELQFDSDELWVHRRLSSAPSGSIDPDAYAVHGNRDPEILNAPARRAVGHVADILVTVRLVSPSTGARHTEWDQRRDGLSWAYAQDWSAEMRSRINTYSSKIAELEQARVHLDTARKAKAVAEAKSLWDQA